MGIKKAKTKEMRVVAASELGTCAAALAVLEQIALPTKQRSTQILPGDAKQATAALVEKLKFEARVL
jgi:electron transfer flavoprotein beta subunit